MIHDFKSYGKRIKAKLMEENSDKYKFLSETSISRHIQHIGWCLIQVVKTHNDDFESPYFKLKKAFRKRKYWKYIQGKSRRHLEKEKSILESLKK
jgi:hypothetical protein